PELRDLLAELSPDHFDSDLNRRAREHLLEPGEADRDLIQLLAELDARAAAEGIDEATTKELLLNLHERKLRRELQNADFERTKELQEELEPVRSATTNLGETAARIRHGRAPMPGRSMGRAFGCYAARCGCASNTESHR